MAMSDDLDEDDFASDAEELAHLQALRADLLEGLENIEPRIKELEKLQAVTRLDATTIKFHKTTFRLVEKDCSDVP